jgi:F-type H+-transporting ATPase subunit delta
MANVANVYARAFADVIFHLHLDPHGTLQQVQSLADLMHESRELREVWATPSIPAVQKRAVLDALVARENISQPVRNFLAVLIDHRRVNFLVPVLEQLEREINQRLGIAEAQVTSARELADGERRSLELQVGQLTGKQVQARYAEDASILGGAIVRVGSTIYDGSVKGKLERMKEALSS